MSDVLPSYIQIFIFTVQYSELFILTVHAITTSPNSAIAIFPKLNADIEITPGLIMQSV